MKYVRARRVGGFELAPSSHALAGEIVVFWTFDGPASRLYTHSRN